ncbi:MAG: hypothetical protein ACRDQZ_02720 [Mycobacteriales bacterium]
MVILPGDNGVVNKKQRKSRAKRRRSSGPHSESPPESQTLVAQNTRKSQPEEYLAGVLGLARGGSRAGERRVYGAEVAALKQEMAGSFSAFDPLHVLAAAYMHFNISIGPYVASRQEPNTTVEYIATILLEREDQTRATERRELGAFNEALMGAHRSVRFISALSAFASQTWRHEVDPWAALRGLASGYRQSIRGTAYAEDERTLFLELTSTVTDAVGLLLGVAPQTAIDTFDALVDRLEGVVGRRFDRMRSRVSALEGFPTSQLPLPLRRVGRRRRRRMVEEMAFVEAFLGYDAVEDFTFSAKDVSPSGASVDAVERLLMHFVTEFGSLKGTHFLSHDPAIVAAPLVRRGDRYLVTSPAGFLHALRPRVEVLLKPTDAWPTYEAGRARIIERRATQALARALGAGKAVWTNAGFDIDGAGGWEADGVIRSDDLLIIVEAKAGRLDLGDFRDDLRQLVGRASQQTARLRSAIQERRLVSFHRRPSGEPIDVDLEGISRIETIAVTLEDLSFLNGRANLLVAAGLARDSRSIPWLINLFDLEQICDLTEFPAQLSLYIRKRGLAIERSLVTLDELDVWMCFLTRSLNFPGTGPVYLDTRFTESIDAYRMEEGPRPRQPFDPDTRTKLDAESQDGRPGSLRRSETLIERFQAGRTPATGEMDFSSAAKLALGPHLS